MAIRKVGEGVTAWTNKMFFPKDKYTIRCIEEESGTSKGDNPMITRTWEIIAPETIQVGDRTLSVGGLKVTQYRPTKVRNAPADVEAHGEWDSEKSDKSFNTFTDELKNAGVDVPAEIDDETPPCLMKDVTVAAVLHSKEDKARKSPTPEQMKKGQKVGDPILDENGKEIKTYQLQLDSILYPVTTETNRAF